MNAFILSAKINISAFIGRRGVVIRAQPKTKGGDGEWSLFRPMEGHGSQHEEFYIPCSITESMNQVNQKDTQ